MENTQWLGKERHCDICGTEFSDHFYDAATVMGPWALMCSRCFQKFGKGVGLGLGQVYDNKTKEKIGG